MMIGERLKRIRLEKGMTQRQFGKLIHKPHTGISKIERGIQCLNMNDIEHITKILNISVLDLIYIPTNELATELEKREGFINEFYGG